MVFREKVTEQVAVRPDPVSEQAVGENAPVALDHATGPPGVMPAPVSVSVTVAVHVEGAPTGTGVAHATDVEVCRAVAVSCWDPALAPCCWLPA
jgi:hypothetical protein